jgi:hypothetical protein
MSKESSSSISSIANELERVPERVEDARKALEGWKGDVEKMVKKNPVRTVLGAFAIGYVVAKVGRYI